ncbi:glycosyltransferase [Patescibacteria group bacterium]|nr:glycosyltransferase [Patescibacteria group bacterium]
MSYENIPFVSIIIPLKKINEYIRESMAYILNLDYDKFEIILFPDESSKETFKKTKIIATGPIGPAEKRDLALKYAKGEIFAFLDDDAFPRRDWLKNAVKHFKDSSIAAVGGPAVTPENDSIWQQASGAVFETKLGGGNYTYRYVPQKMRVIDDYPSVNFLVRRDIFQQLGGFDSIYWPGEDTKLCLEITKRLGKKIIYDPKVLVWHHRRYLFAEHLNQIKGYALHRGYFAKTLPETSLRLSYFIPSFFVAFLLIGIPLSLYHKIFSLGYLLVALFYLCAIFLSGLITSIRKRNLIIGILTMLGIISTHITYGLYFIKGLITKELKR